MTVEEMRQDLLGRLYLAAVKDANDSTNASSVLISAVNAFNFALSREKDGG